MFLNGSKLCRIAKKDREITKELNYSGVDFLVSKKDYSKILVLNKISINVFCYENKVVHPVYLVDQCFNDSMNLLLISNGFTSHYCILNILTDLCLTKLKIKIRYIFVRVVYCVLAVKLFF